VHLSLFYIPGGVAVMSKFFSRFLKISPRIAAVLQALFVTFLWSTSWVLIKLGLADIPALTFAGLRYTGAFLCLLPFTFTRTSSASWGRLSPRDWLRLLLLGFLFYTLTQGAQFLALAYLPAVTVSLLLNFTTTTVALMGIALLDERPSRFQWAGVAINLLGIFIYFYPADFPTHQFVGIIVALIGVAANAGSSILGRYVNRPGAISPLQVTTVSMGFGAVLLLGAGLLTQGLPALSPSSWAIVAWLAVVNTAFAFTMWNKSLRVLSAVESSIINSTMLIQIAVLAWLFLGEVVTWQAWLGMLLAGTGVLIVQVRRPG
jgi:drug/metabolite transporter (DMT)-like permease